MVPVRVCLLMLIGLVSQSLLADPVADREAYSHPLPGLEDQARERFNRGRAEFQRVWVAPPGGGDSTGLGPLFNRLACASCHLKNGPGRSPNSPGERMQSMLVRLSLPGQGDHGGVLPHPAYGGQLNEEGVPGVPGEGRASIHWKASRMHLSGGEVVVLRHPVLKFTDLAYGPLKGVLTSPRVGPAIFGLGLLESVSTETLEALAASQKSLGLAGHLNRVWDVSQQTTATGRMGWKANSPSLRQQIAEAFLGDMGITTPLFPNQNCTTAETACQQAQTTQTELSSARLDDIEFYVAHLAPPAPRDRDDPVVRHGESIFSNLGCAHCHRPQLETAAHPKFPALGARPIAPYSDLLLHDMGPGLADGRPDFAAGPGDWRTAPLWGIGLRPLIAGHHQYLHDGRARNLQEAILWHGGEARETRDRYARMAKPERQALLRFLASL